MILYFCLIFIIVFLSSILTGLLGIGGGILIIPAFLFILPFTGTSLSIHYIVGISAQCILINSIFGLYYKRKSSFLPLSHILLYGTFCILGTLPGSIIQNKINPSWILMIYILIFILSFYLTNKKNRTSDLGSNSNPDLTAKLPRAKITSMSFIFFTIGVLSSIVGIGGAIFYIVILKYFYKLSIKELVPTSTLLVLITSLFMVIENFYLQPDLSFSLLPLIIVASIFGVFTGNYLYKKLSSKTLHLLFNIIMILSLVRVVLSFIKTL